MISKMLNLYLSGLQVFSTLPVRQSQKDFNLNGIAKIMPYIGLTIGLLILFISFVATKLISFPNSIYLSSVLILVLWYFITGIIHLDGLSDMADAYISCYDKEKRLEIMKDPHVGTGGVFALVSNMLLKLGCIIFIITIFQESQTFNILLILFLTPVMGRFACYIAALNYPYVREKGFAKIIKDTVDPRKDVYIVFLCAIIAFVVGIAGFYGTPNYDYFIMIFVFGLCIAYFVPQFLSKMLNGHTGDTYGASIELTETLFLLCSCIFWGVL